MKKILTVFFAILLVLTFGVSAFAAEASDAGDYAADEAVTAEPATDAKEDVNFFDTAFSAVKKYAAEILSALTLVGSMILAFTYKRGLLPALGSALGSIGTSVKSVAEVAEKSATSSESSLCGISAAIEELGDTLGNMQERIASLDEELKRTKADGCNAKTMNTVMRAQVDMLYDIFMTSALPQYAKDAVGERISAMKAELCEGEENA